ncbi:MAG: hypothetical protein JSS42_07735 [Proteobacteria bacterium]|nr:hypothetical protein [Pseudomonadota bacterium]
MAIATGLCASTAAFSAPVTAGSPNAAPQSAKARLSSAQLAEVQARISLGNQIVQNVSADAQAKGASDSWRVGLLDSLYNTPSSALRNISASATTLNQAHAQAAQAQLQAAASRTASAAGGGASANAVVPDLLGSAGDSLVFNPKTPCRFIDTRNVGGAIGTTARAFDTFFFGSTYGGDSACTLPGAGEPAIAANVTIVAPDVAAGYIAIRPTGSTALTSWMNWINLGAGALANAGVVATALNGSSHYAFEILTGGGNVQVILDYFGYFSASPATALTLTNGTYETVSLAIGYNTFHYTTAVCPANTTPVSAYCYNNGNTDVYLTGSGINGGAWCGWHNLQGVAVNVTQNVFCAQVP